jgi:lipopolysaccharide biosynthesis regulator YciM
MASEAALSLVEEMSDSAIREGGGDVVARRVYGVIQSFPEHEQLSEGQLADLNALLALVDHADEVLSEDKKILKAVKLIMLGKLGLFERAIAESTAIYEEEPDWTNAVGVANAYKRAGDAANAIRMFVKALEHDQEDISALLEIGDLHLERDDFSEALGFYERALHKDNQHPWAAPSALYCQYRLTKDDDNLTQLQAMAKAEDCECGVAGLLAQITGDAGAAHRAEYLLEKLEGA